MMTGSRTINSERSGEIRTVPTGVRAAAAGAPRKTARKSARTHLTRISEPETAVRLEQRRTCRTRPQGRGTRYRRSGRRDKRNKEDGFLAPRRQTGFPLLEAKEAGGRGCGKNRCRSGDGRGAVGHPTGIGRFAATTRRGGRGAQLHRLHLRERGADNGEEKPDQTFHGTH